jgi:hypothetical protein
MEIPEEPSEPEGLSDEVDTDGPEGTSESTASSEQKQKPAEAPPESSDPEVSPEETQAEPPGKEV